MARYGWARRHPIRSGLYNAASLLVVLISVWAGVAAILDILRRLPRDWIWLKPERPEVTVILLVLLSALVLVLPLLMVWLVVKPMTHQTDSYIEANGLDCFADRYCGCELHEVESHVEAAA